MATLYCAYQDINENDALQIALCESLQMYQNNKENKDLELAIKLSLADANGNCGCLDGRLPCFDANETLALLQGKTFANHRLLHLSSKIRVAKVRLGTMKGH